MTVLLPAQDFCYGYT